MSVEDLASYQVMIRCGEDIAKNTGWYPSEYLGTMYSWNLALGFSNTSLFWFSSLTLASLSPMMALLVPARKYWCSLSFCPWPTALLPLWVLQHALLQFIVTAVCSKLPNLIVHPWHPPSSRLVCTTVWWAFPLDDQQGFAEFSKC